LIPFWSAYMMGTIRVPAPGVFAMGFALRSIISGWFDGGRELAIKPTRELYGPAEAPSSEIAAS